MSILKKSENLPVGAIATALGLATLATVYGNLGFMWVRHITMVAMIFVWLGAIIKMTRYHKTFREDYTQVVSGSLYATFTMLTMVIGSYLFMFSQPLGKGIWLVGTILHMIHILIFTYRNVIRTRAIATFLPSWFVTYVGMLVSVTVGVEKGMPNLLMGLIFYGIIIYFILLPIMLWRMFKHPIPPQFSMTRAIFLAPSSLVVVGYLTVTGLDSFQGQLNQPILFTAYGVLFVSLLYVGFQLIGWLKKPFNPGFAALTFPSAIALVATSRMSGYLLNNGYTGLGNFLNEFFGIQLWITTGIMAYVGFGFLKILMDSFNKETK